MTPKRQKHTTGGIPRWSPTLVLVARFSAYVWQSGRDAQFSLTYGRMYQYCLDYHFQKLPLFGLGGAIQTTDHPTVTNLPTHQDRSRSRNRQQTLKTPITKSQAESYTYLRSERPPQGSKVSAAPSPCQVDWSFGVGVVTQPQTHTEAAIHMTHS
jgi:hypothetical protein